MCKQNIKLQTIGVCSVSAAMRHEIIPVKYIRVSQERSRLEFLPRELPSTNGSHFALPAWRAKPGQVSTILLSASTASFASVPAAASLVKCV